MPSLQYSQLQQRATLLTHKSAGIVSGSDRLALANMALDQMQGDMDLFESKRFSVLDPALFSEVFDYSLPSDLKADAIIDIRQAGDGSRVVYEKKPNVAFDYETRRNNGSDGLGRGGLADYSIEADRGARYIRINGQNQTKKSIIHGCDSLTDNGTWSANTATSDASNLVLNTQNFKNGGGSLQFDIIAAQSVNNYAEISNAAMTAVDLTDYKDLGVIFFWVYIPSSTNITSWTIRLGSDASNYYEATVTTNHQGQVFSDGENLLRVDWSDFVATGSPVITGIDYALVRVNYSASQANMAGILVDDIVARLGKFHKLLYYSQNLVQTSAGAFSRSFANDNDSSVMLPESETIFLYLWAYLIDSSRREGNAAGLFQQYQILRDQYLIKYPSERSFLGFEYATQADPNNRIGLRWN